MAELQLRVVGMSCEHCQRAVESALCDLPGVTAAAADCESGRVTVGTDTKVPDTMLREAIDEAGYRLVELKR